MSATLTQPPVAAGLLDVHAVAELLNCSPRHVYRLFTSLRMPAPLKVGALVRWRRADIEAWIAAGCPRVEEGKIAAARA
jgi:excisionase family DNA binding protein